MDMEGEATRASIDTKSFCYRAVYGDRDKGQRLVFFVLKRDANKVVIKVSVGSLRPESSQVVLPDKRRKCECLL